MANQKSTPKFQDANCRVCGAPQRVVNPAWLRRARTLAGMTLRDFARHAGCSAAYICDIEHGRRNCLPPMLGLYESLTHEQVSGR